MIYGYYSIAGVVDKKSSGENAFLLNPLSKEKWCRSEGVCLICCFKDGCFEILAVNGLPTCVSLVPTLTILTLHTAGSVTFSKKTSERIQSTPTGLQVTVYVGKSRKELVFKEPG